MSDAPDPLTGLDELAACDLRLAKRFCARIESLPEDEDDKAMALARSYQRMARSYRQTLVVQARLRRELKVEAKQDEGEARAVRRERGIALQAAIRAEITPRIWTPERERDDGEDLEAMLRDLLFRAAARDDFLDLSAQAHAAAILEDLPVDTYLAPEAAEDDADDDDPDEEGAEGAPDAPPQGELAAKPPEGASSPAADAPPPLLFNGRLAPPMDIPPWADDSS
jgi:hypothetical protein